MSAPRENREDARRHLYWCRKCGIVWADEAAPLCRHGVIDGPAVARMEPLPKWHPYGDLRAPEPRDA
jgi:hypothetical protein